MFIYKDKKNWWKYLVPMQMNHPTDGMEGLIETIFWRWLNLGWTKDICL